MAESVDVIEEAVTEIGSAEETADTEVDVASASVEVVTAAL